MVDAIELQKDLICNPDKILVVLESLGFKPVDRGKYVNMKNLDGDNSAAISMLKSTLHYENYTRGKKGNLFTLVQDIKHCSFPDALQYIASKVGYKGAEYKNIVVKKPFGGFYECLIGTNKKEIVLPDYNEKSLPSAYNLSLNWFKSGVSYKTQEKFGIRMDLESNRIVIPVYDINNRLVGAKGRNNDTKCSADQRWSMFIPYAKSQVIYGLNYNYRPIIEKSTLIIFEAEKSVQLCHEYGIDFVTAIGGHSLSNTQVKLIQSMMCNNIVVAFDEGISEDEIEYETRKLVISNRFMSNRVGYIYDKNNKFLAKGSKDSPADLGGNVLRKMLKESVVWL